MKFTTIIGVAATLLGVAFASSTETENVVGLDAEIAALRGKVSGKMEPAGETDGADRACGDFFDPTEARDLLQIRCADKNLTRDMDFTYFRTDPDAEGTEFENLVIYAYDDTRSIRYLLSKGENNLVWYLSEWNRIGELDSNDEYGDPKFQFTRAWPDCKCYDDPEEVALKSCLLSCKATADSVPGCMYQAATNFNANATVDDGSCLFTTPAPN